MNSNNNLLQLYQSTVGRKEHRNFLTPKILKVKANKNRIVELSTGEGLFNAKLYGVSYWTKTALINNCKDNDSSEKSNCFNDYQAAVNYYNSL